MSDQDKPSKVTLNLDSIEREDKPDPFVVVRDGKRYEFRDAKEVDYRELIQAQRHITTGNYQAALEFFLEEEDRAGFFKGGMSTWKLNRLFEDYSKHFGMPMPGESRALS